MTIEQMLVIGILTVAMILFISERIRADLVAILVMIAVVLTGLLTPIEAFSGFANPAVVTVWAIFIISGGFYYTGVADRMGEALLKLSGQSYRRLLLLIMLLVGFMSAFMNNIGAVAILMPAIVTISRQRKIPPSKLLMPLAFAALMGGNLTLIGTPPNLIANTILTNYGRVDSFGFFDFLPMGLIVLLCGIVYMMFIGDKLLPDRSTPSDELSQAYSAIYYLSEICVDADSDLVGKTILDSQLGRQYALNIIQIRHGDQVLEPAVEYTLKAGDILVVEGSFQDLLDASEAHALSALSSSQEPTRAFDEASEEMVLAEISLTRLSRRTGQTLRGMEFRKRYNLNVIAIRHNGQDMASHLGDIPLVLGDVLLVQGQKEALTLLRSNPNFEVLDIAPRESKRTGKAWLAVALFAAGLLVITAGWVDVATALVTVAVGMVLFGILNMDEAYRSIDWQSIFLIAGTLPMGITMEQTGTARLIADQIISLIGGGGTVLVLAGIFVLTAILTSIISNAAATVLMVPIAIDAAFGLGVDPRPFVMATVIAASTAFMTPIGHQVNIIIYGPGGYKFLDYTKVGLGLNLMVLFLVVTVLPLIWPF